MSKVKAEKKITEEKVWMKYYSEEAQKAQAPKYKVFDYVMIRNMDRLEQPALHYYGRDISFLELRKRVDAAAKAFAALGVREGDIVSFLSVQTPETIASVYALSRIGAVANCIDPRMDISSIRRMIQESGSRILVVLDIAFPKVRAIMAAIKQDRIIVQSPYISLPPVAKMIKMMTTKTDVTYSGKVIKWEEFFNNGKDTYYKEAPYRGDATVAITYTGGTTGIPKGVMLTNDSMNAVSVNFEHCDAVMEPGDRFLGIIPIFSAYGMVCGLHMPLCLSVTVVPIPGFVPPTIGKLVRQFRPNHIISTPVFIELLMSSKEVQNMDLSFLRTLACGGDSMNAGLEEKLDVFRKKHNMAYPLAQGYGMSELSAAASFCVNRVYRRGSVGVPSLNVNVGIFDPETGEELSYHERGEVCVTGPTMMKGYFNAPEETANVMRKHDDGEVWIHSGDLGYMDEDGFLYIVGRIKRMITRFDGHKVFPVNLENLIGAREDVNNVAVIGVNDRTHSQGQFPLVVVELEPGVEPKAACKDIFEMCDKQVEERGKPVAVLAVEKMPLTGLGKNDYRRLGDMYGRFDYLSWNPGC